MSQDRQVIIRSPTRAIAPVKRASTGQPEDQSRSDLNKEIEKKKAKLQERALSAVESEAEPSKLRSQKLNKFI